MERTISPSAGTLLPAISSSYAAIAADITAMSSSSDIVLSALTEGVAATGAAGAGALAGAASGAGLASYCLS